MHKLAQLRAAGHIELAKQTRAAKQIRSARLTVKDVASFKGKFKYRLLPSSLVGCLLCYPTRFLAMLLDLRHSHGWEYGQGSGHDN